jgi:hypothetical protein
MYTYEELQQLWINNGGNPALAPVMAAIAMAESTGDAGNTTGDGGTSYGLYQVHWTVHPQFNPMQLLDPNYNTNAAIQLSGNGQDLSPWTTWESYIKGDGQHGDQVISQYLGPYNGTQGTASGANANGTPNGSLLGNLAQSASNFGTWLSGNELNVVTGKNQPESFIQYLFGGNNPYLPSIVVGAAAITLALIGGIWLAVSSGTASVVINETKKGAELAA